MAVMIVLTALTVRAVPTVTAIRETSGIT